MLIKLGYLTGALLFALCKSALCEGQLPFGHFQLILDSIQFLSGRVQLLAEVLAFGYRNGCFKLSLIRLGQLYLQLIQLGVVGESRLANTAPKNRDIYAL
ncbi:hypothetical protein ACPFL9_15930 [Paenarthrobacter sp. NyZ202]|uniref:hypothetical protein n=1 Tax=Paenarthrobacter sp. NyZ202 TaxID=3402689 RepID=UPI003CECE51C